MRYFLYPAIVASFALPASAGAAAETVTEVVSFADLDLRTSEGRQTLEGRIAAAVISVCGAPPMGSLWASNALKECRAAAAEDAKAQLDAHLATITPVSIAAAE